MTDKDGNISDTMRSIADLLDDHGDKIDPIVDKFVGGTGEKQSRQADGDIEPLTEVHELDDGYLIITELKSGNVQNLAVEQTDSGYEIWADEDHIIADIDGETDPTSFSVAVNNGVLQMEVKKVN